jgi:hypothetical protein
MPCYSLVEGVTASYLVEAGTTKVTISSRSPLKHRDIFTGTGQMVFHWVQEGKTQAWKCDISMADRSPAQVEETPAPDGSQNLGVVLKELYPAGLLLQGRMVGALVAPAIHIDIPWGTDVWVFMVRSPWFHLQQQLGKPTLAVQHDVSKATANLALSPDGGLSAQVAMEGTSFKNASLALRRTLGQFSFEEVVCSIGAGSGTFSWTPILRSFDLMLVTKGSISESQLAEVARGLGAQVSAGMFGSGSVEGDYVLCDGPALSYAWTLKGHRGFLESAQDQTDARIGW